MGEAAARNDFNPYGRFRLDLSKRVDPDVKAA